MKSGILVVLPGFVLSLLLIPAHTNAQTQTLTFQQGDGGAYSTTQAGWAQFLGTGNGSGTTLYVSVDYLMQYFSIGKETFLRFPDIIGSNPGQIPPGSTIESATLQLTRANASSHGAILSRVLTGWDENTLDGYHMPSSSGSVGVLPTGGPGPQVKDITPTVQLWASGTPNWGLAIGTGNVATTFTETFYSDDATDAATRPLLTVTFTPPATPVQSTTWGKVKALYRGSTEDGR